jgi:hypothetical protein
MLTSIRNVWDVMSWKDLATFLASLSVSLLIGGTILYFIFSRLTPRRRRNDEEDQDEEEDEDFSTRKPSSQQRKNKGGTLPFEVEEEIARKIRETPAHKALLEKRQAADNFEKKVETVRRNIPLGASSVLVQKGVRLIEEGSYDEALVCFLALLYSAVEGGRAQPDNLPAHLAECLRGAGTCYRKMGQIEIAARFFQAERLIYEEMVSSVTGDSGNANKTPDVTKSRAIVASLFSNVGDDEDEKNPEKSLPRRCRILQDVADACMKHGHVQVALSYQLKMAAVKRKVSGKAMEPNSDEFQKIAEMLKKLSPDEVQAAQQSANNAVVQDDVVVVDQILKEVKEATTTKTTKKKNKNNKNADDDDG